MAFSSINSYTSLYRQQSLSEETFTNKNVSETSLNNNKSINGLSSQQDNPYSAVSSEAKTMDSFVSTQKAMLLAKLPTNTNQQQVTKTSFDGSSNKANTKEANEKRIDSFGDTSIQQTNAKPVSQLSTQEKLGEAIKRSLPLLAPEIREKVASLLTPESLAIFATVTSAWAAAHLIGVGEAADVVLLVGGGIVLGADVISVLNQYGGFINKAINAKTESDLDLAAKDFAQATSTLGVTLLQVLITRQAGKSIKSQIPPPNSAPQLVVAGTGGARVPVSASAIEGVAKPKSPFVVLSASQTTPSSKPSPSNTPSGKPTKINPKDDPSTIRSLTKENESAKTLAESGYNIEQNPISPGKKNPDYKIEGEFFDCYAPSTSNVKNLVGKVADKVEDNQAARIVLNLDDAPVSLESLKKELITSPIPKLEEIIIIKDGKVTRFYPF